MISEERIQRLPEGIKKCLMLLRKIRVPGIIIYVIISVLASIWFLVRVVPKPSRATYPCMQVAAPIMSGFIIWILALMCPAFAFKKVKRKLFEAKYLAASVFLILGIAAATVFVTKSAGEAKAGNPGIWYKPNQPLGVAKGIFPGRVAWGHNSKIASWDGKTGFWWEDRFNNQAETDKLSLKPCLV